MKIAIIGGVAGGMSAAAKAKREKKDAEIVVFEKGKFVSYGACGMPFFLGGEIHDYNELIVRRPEDFEKAGIKVKLGWEVKEIDLKKFELTAENERGDKEKHSFDKLIIATGARSRILNIPGKDLKGVFTLKTLDDAINIDNYIRNNNVKTAVVIGAGFIGLELIEAFVKRGLKVISVDIVETPPPQFDPDMTEGIKEICDKNKVETYWGVGVDEIEGNDKVETVKIAGESINADMVVFSVGVIPNSELAERAGIELGVARSIKVDHYMQTNIEGVFAAGDCTHSYSAVTGKPLYLPLGSIANRHGRIAAVNAIGKRYAMKPIAGTAIVKFFDMGLARAGLTENEALKAGINIETVTIKALDKAHYYPGATRLKVKLIWEKESGKIVGAELFGHYSAVKRIDVIAALIVKGATVEDLKASDLAYSPPFSPVWDPLLVAANQAVKE